MEPRLTWITDDLATEAGCPSPETKLGKRLKELAAKAELIDQAKRDAKRLLQEAADQESAFKCECLVLQNTDEYVEAQDEMDRQRAELYANRRSIFQAAREDADEQALLNCGGTLDATGRVISDADEGL